MPPPSKRAKRQPTSAAPAIPRDSAQDNTPCYLLRLPLEILAEILRYVRLSELLSLARTSKYFCRILCDPGSSFLWKRARMDPDLLFVIPDPPPNMAEPAYAATIFDPGKCYVCQKETNKLFHSYAYRARLCSKSACTRHWNQYLPSSIFSSGSGKFTTLAEQTEFFRTVFEETDDSLLHTLALCGSVRLDPLETSGYEPGSPQAIYLTEDLESAIRAFSKKYFQAKGDPQAFDALMSTYALQKEIQSQRYQHFLRLQSWSRNYEEHKKLIITEHLQHFQSFAVERYLEMSDMEKGMTFLRVKKLCGSRFDEPISKVMEPYVERIIAETGVIAEARERRAYERRLLARRQDIKNYYKDYDAPILPNLQVFRNLPILHALQRKSAAENIQEDLQSDAITTSVRDELGQWIRRAKDDVMELFGFGRRKGFEEYRPQASKTHPLERVTALFQCKECKRVGGSYGRMGVLDFKGLCLHECIQPGRSIADRTKWSASDFELATNAVATARAALDALGRDDDTTSFNYLRSKWFRCDMCAHGVRDMVFEDLLRHCQRHATQSVTHVSGDDHRPQHKEPAKRLRPVTELRSGKHNCEVMRHQFACSQCRFRIAPQTRAGTEPTWVEVENPKRMDFNALRSHLRARHEIHDVRNEDYYWLPWDKSMEAARKEERKKKKAKKPVTPAPPVAPEPEPEPMEEELIPEPAYLLQKRRVHVKRHFCNHCAATATTTATAGARGFDWQGLTAHMKARHCIDKPADDRDYEYRDQSPSEVVPLAGSGI